MDTENILETWLGPISVEKFKSDYLSKKILFRDATKSVLDSMSSPHDWNVDRLLRNPSVKALAWFEARDGRHLTADLPNDSARKLYQGGVTLYLREVPELDATCDAIARALCVPRRNITGTLFCNTRGAHTRAHFDPIDTLTVQLKGHKRWRLAPNSLAPNPTTSWATLDGTARKSELWLYGHDALPVESPEGAEDFVLTPGAVLNVPRGFWHETFSDEESVSLHIHHTPLPWVDAMLISLRGLLLRDPRLRAGANELWAPEDADANAKHVEQLLEALVSAAHQLSPDDVLITPRKPKAPLAANDRVARCARAGFVVEGESRVTFSIADYVGERRSTVEMSREYLQACRLFVDPEAPAAFSAADLSNRVPGLSIAQASQLISVLFEVGFVRAAV